MEPLAQTEGNCLGVDVIFRNQHILMESGTAQLLVSLTTDMHGDNVTALYRHGYLAGTMTTMHQAIKLGQTSNKGAQINTEQIIPYNC